MPESFKPETTLLPDGLAEPIIDRPIDEELALSVRGLLAVSNNKVHISNVVKQVYGTRKVEDPIFKGLLGKMHNFVQAGLLIYEPPSSYRGSGPWTEEMVAAPDGPVLEITRPKPRRGKRPGQKKSKSLDQMIHESGVSTQRPAKPDATKRRQRPGVGRNHRRH